MNVRDLINELVRIADDPHADHVTVLKNGGNIAFTFKSPRFFNAREGKYLENSYYYPAGIKRISLQRGGGAGVIYVYTTDQNDPHFTIPFDDGKMPHWTPAQGQKSTYDPSEWPEPVRRFADLFP